MYSEQSPIVEQIRGLLRQLGRRPEISDRPGLEAALDDLRNTALRDFDQAAFYGKRHDEIWQNQLKLISALAGLAMCGFPPAGTFEWSEIRAEELRPGMFVEDNHRRWHTDGDERNPDILVVIYAQVVGDSFESHLYLVATSTDLKRGALSSSGGVFARGALVRACQGVSDRIGGTE